MFLVGIHFGDRTKGECLISIFSRYGLGKKHGILSLPQFVFDVRCGDMAMRWFRRPAIGQSVERNSSEERMRFQRIVWTTVVAIAVVDS